MIVNLILHLVSGLLHDIEYEIHVRVIITLLTV